MIDILAATMAAFIYKPNVQLLFLPLLDADERRFFSFESAESAFFSIQK
jgi:hypothetical protein